MRLFWSIFSALLSGSGGVDQPVVGFSLDDRWDSTGPAWPPDHAGCDSSIWTTSSDLPTTLACEPIGSVFDHNAWP